MTRLAVTLALVALAGLARAAAAEELYPLDDPRQADVVLETFLAPGDFPGRRLVLELGHDEAAYALDATFAGGPPTLLLRPERLSCPVVGGLPVEVTPSVVELAPGEVPLSEADLDAGLRLRVILEAEGQLFSGTPRFRARLVLVELWRADGRLIARLEVDALGACLAHPAAGEPRCDLSGIGREARALDLSPDGRLAVLAFAGLRPRLEVYALADVPRLAWTARFPSQEGGVLEASFTADGEWIVALSGSGRLHRFAADGGRHLALAAAGRTARSLPPGFGVAVSGDGGEVTIWQMADGTISWRLPSRNLASPLDRLAASGDGRRLATLDYEAERTVVRVFEPAARRLVSTVQVEAWKISDIVLDGVGARLFLTHAERGLLVVPVGAKKDPVSFGGEAGTRCRDRARWIGGAGLLLCAVAGGVSLMDAEGRATRFLKAELTPAQAIVAAAEDGGRIAALADGHLYLWDVPAPAGPDR